MSKIAIDAGCPSQKVVFATEPAFTAWLKKNGHVPANATVLEEPGIDDCSFRHVYVMGMCELGTNKVHCDLPLRLAAAADRVTVFYLTVPHNYKKGELSLAQIQELIDEKGVTFSVKQNV